MARDLDGQGSQKGRAKGRALPDDTEQAMSC